MAEYISIMLNALTNVVNSDTFQVIAFISGVVSIAWNLAHAISWIEIKCLEKCIKFICLSITLTVFVIGAAACFMVSFGWIFQIQLPKEWPPLSLRD
jgi:hypothetical protein